MKRIVLLIAVFAVAGCGGSKHTATTTQSLPDPAQALRALIVAAHQGDTSAIPQLLTADSQATASELGEGLGTFYGKPVRTLYETSRWAVALVTGPRTVEGTHEQGAYAAALKLVGGRWRADLSGKVQLRTLGPDPAVRAAARPQVAVEITAPEPLVESGLWVDGRELQAKGGGSARRGTIYGAPRSALAPGLHVAVAFARTATHGTAVAWTFRV